MRKYRNQVLAGLLFITLVLIAVIGVTGADDLGEKLRDYPPWLFLPVLALKIGNWALRYMEWRYFLGVIGVRTVRGLPERPAPDSTTPVIRERDSAVLWIAGLAMSISPGKVAEVLKALVLKHLTGMDFTRAAPVIFMERLVDGLAIIPMTAVAMIALGGDVDTGDVSLSYVRAALIVVTVVLVAIMIVVQFRGLAHWLLNLVAEWPGIWRIHGPLVNLYDSVYDLIKIRHLIPTVLFGMGAYATDIIGFYILLTGLGLDPSGTLFFQAAFILGFSVIVASLSALPGGAGGREITIGAMLTGLVGLSKVDSGTGTFLIGLWQLWIGVLLALIVIAVFRDTLFPLALSEEIAAHESGHAEVVG